MDRVPVQMKNTSGFRMDRVVPPCPDEKHIYPPRLVFIGTREFFSPKRVSEFMLKIENGSKPPILWFLT